MNKAMGAGLIERAIYTIVLGLAMKGVERKWWDNDMAIYIAVTAMGAPALIRGWWVNRPQRLLDDAADTLPKNVKLDMVPSNNATHAEKTVVRDLAEVTGDKVTSAKLAPA